MPRKLTATLGVLLVLGVAGCGGKDKPASTTAQLATTPATATTTPPTVTSDATPSKSKTSASKKSTAGKTTSTAKTTTPAKKTKKTKKSTKTKKTAPAKATGRPKKATPATTTTPKTPVGVTPASGNGASTGTDLSDGTGSGPASERLQVVSVLKRYYRAFIDGDGATVCSLLTSDGRDIMIRDGGAKTCAANIPKLVKQAGADNVALLERTRTGLHINDITLTGNNAVAQIGKTSQLRLVQENGDWLLRSPNVFNGS